MRRVAALVALSLVAVAAAAAARTAPNGRIAYDVADRASSGDQFEYTANPDGSGARPIVPGHTCCAAWSSDGRRLTINRLLDDGRIGTAIVNADGSGYRPLPIPDPTLNLPCGPSSPDDAVLACQGWDDNDPGRTGVYLVSASDGAILRRLTNPAGGTDEPGSFSPDGHRFVFARFDPAGNPLGLFVVDTNSRNLRRITPPGTLIQPGNDGDWSPQGNEIVFSLHAAPTLRGSLWVVHADGSGLHEIPVPELGCGGSVFDPHGVGCHGAHWSPDGTRIVFGANSSAGGRDIYTVGADGTGVVQVTHDGTADDPDWGRAPAPTR